jgi:hypothetical protein
MVVLYGPAQQTPIPKEMSLTHKIRKLRGPHPVRQRMSRLLFPLFGLIKQIHFF